MTAASTSATTTTATSPPTFTVEVFTMGEWRRFLGFATRESAEKYRLTLVGMFGAYAVRVVEPKR